VGETIYTLLQGYKNKKLLGSKCDKCNRVYLPARTFCPTCHIELNNFVETSTEGKLVSWCLTDFEFFGIPVPPPFITAFIDIEGVYTRYIHLVKGVDVTNLKECRRILTPGRKMGAVWKSKRERVGCIMDIEYFKPVL
jgi:hypothetical protein